jgi:hypothetical protein
MQVKKMISYGCIVLVVHGCLAAVGTPFIIEKKNRAISCSKLKEQAIDQLGDALRLVPSVLRSLADIQEQVQAAIEAYITGQKGCFWDSADKDQLRLCCAKTEQCKLQLEVLNKELADFAAYAKKLG